MTKEKRCYRQTVIHPVVPGLHRLFSGLLLRRRQPAQRSTPLPLLTELAGAGSTFSAAARTLAGVLCLLAKQNARLPSCRQRPSMLGETAREWW